MGIQPQASNSTIIKPKGFAACTADTNWPCCCERRIWPFIAGPMPGLSGPGLPPTSSCYSRCWPRRTASPQITIVERTASDPNTVTAMLRLLEQRGLIRREAHSEDGRARCVFLTGEGKKVQRRLAREADVLLAELWKAVDEKARPTLLAALRQVHDTFSFFSEPKVGWQRPLPANASPRRPRSPSR